MFAYFEALVPHAFVEAASKVWIWTRILWRACRITQDSSSGDTQYHSVPGCAAALAMLYIRLPVQFGCRQWLCSVAAKLLALLSNLWSKTCS
jgi:hypothetical protein